MIENARRNREAIIALFGWLLVPLGVTSLLYLICGGIPQVERVLAFLGYYGLTHISLRVVSGLMDRWYPIEGDGPLRPARSWFPR